MTSHDNDRRPGLSGFRHSGNGHTITRTCGKCGKPRPNQGGMRHKVYGWVADCCAKPKEGSSK